VWQVLLAVKGALSGGPVSEPAGVAGLKDISLNYSRSAFLFCIQPAIFVMFKIRS
jgi:hypothetical protein